MINFDAIYLIAIFIIFNFFWINASFKENGGFDKKETIINLFGNLAIYIIYREQYPIDSIKFGLVLGSILLAVGLPIFKLLANGSTKER